MSLLVFNKCNLKSQITLWLKLVQNIKIRIFRDERVKKFYNFFEVSSPIPRAWANTLMREKSMLLRLLELDVQSSFKQLKVSTKLLRECLCKSGPVDFAWDTDLAHFSCVVRHSCTHRRPKLISWTRTWLLLTSGVVLQTVIYKGLYGIQTVFLKREKKCIFFKIKSTYLIALLYSLLFARASGRLEAFSAS